MNMIQSAQPEIVVCGIPFLEGEACTKQALAAMKEAGVTSIQIYVFWKMFEPNQRGLFEWDALDYQVKAIQEAGLKFVPFLIMGPKYAAPQWWLDSKDHKGLKCLEHKQESKIESIWNPAFHAEIIRVLDAFAAHYLPMNVLESVQPGICGDYGESIFPVHGNWPGDYHTHKGYWCGGEDAIADFRTWLKARYKTIQDMNVAWRSNYKSFEEVVPLLPHQYPSRTALFAFWQWYRDAMTNYSEFWMKECRRAFPNIPVYLCTGGLEEPDLGASFSYQAKIAAKHGGGIRLTNEGNKFYDNFFWTAHTVSACRFYGAYMGLEPVGPITEKGMAARIFGTAAYGNQQFFYYYGNAFNPDQSKRAGFDVAKKYTPLIRHRSVLPTTAFFWPRYYADYHGAMPENVQKALSHTRRIRDCDVIDEEMILDGALATHKLLVMPVACFTSRETLSKIAEWVKAGGVLLAAGRITDIELEDVPEFNELFGIMTNSEIAAGCSTQLINAWAEYPQFSAIRTREGIAGYFTDHAWINLHPDTVKLSALKAEAGYSDTTVHAASAAFYRQHGKGRAIYFCAKVRYEMDPESLMDDCGVFPALLADVLNAHSQSEDLTPHGQEVARAMIDGTLMAVEGEEIRPVK